MIPRPFLVVLVFALPTLVVAFAVLMGGVAVVQAMGDVVAAAVLRWVSLGCLMLLVVDLVLLAGVLGVNALSQPDPPSDGSDS